MAQKYSIGTIVKPDGSGYANFLWQDFNLTIEADEYAAKDEKGNTAEVQLRDHRLKGTLNVIIPKGSGIPVQGQKISLKGVVAPSVTVGGVATGPFEADESASAQDFMVTGTPSLSGSNSDFYKGSIEVVRYLENSYAGDAT